MIHRLTLSAALALSLAGPAPAQIVTGGAGNTGVSPPANAGAGPGAQQIGPGDVSVGNEATRSNTPIPGTTPDVNIGGTPTSGPPGTGGTSGGPGFGR